MRVDGIVTEPEGVLTEEESPPKPALPAVVKRESGIGGSEIAAVLGLSPYASPFDVWLSKTGRAPERADNFAMWWGREIQGSIVKAYERERNVLTVKLFDEPRRHPERPWQVGSPDALLGDQAVIEAKAPGPKQAARYGPVGTDEIPDEHALQVRWYMSLLGYEEGHLAVAFGSHDFRIYELKRDRELEDAMLAAAEKFWRQHVQADVPPEVSDTETTREWLRKSFPRELAPLRKATEEEIALTERYATAVRLLAQHEKVVGDLDVKIRALIGADEGVEADDFRLTYRAAKGSSKTDWKAVAAAYRGTLGLIASAVDNAQLQGVPKIAADVVRTTEAKYTTATPGSRRLLKSGVIFNGEEK